MTTYSGSKLINWFRHYGAVIELVHDNPGTRDAEDREFRYTSVTFPRVCVMGDQRGEYLLFPEPTRTVGPNGRSYSTWDTTWLQGCADEAGVPYLGDVYVNNDICRCTWDYMHMWHSNKSHLLWKKHGKEFVSAVIRRLAANDVQYYVDCHYCHGMLKIAEKYDGTAGPQWDEGLCFHSHCWKTYTTQLLHK